MSDRAIIEAVNKMSGQHKLDQVTYIDSEVISVDIPNRKCSCKAIGGHTDYDFPTVRLMASVDDGILIEPVIGSTIKVIFSQNIEPFAVQFSEIENITIITNTKITFQDGSFGGLVKVEELTAKINALESDLNTLKTLFASWVPIPGDGGTVLKTLSATWASNQIQITEKSDLENLTVQHGTN